MSHLTRQTPLRTFCAGLAISTAAYIFSRRNEWAICDAELRSQDIPFSAKKILTAEQIISLKISSCGISENSEFADSLFECEKGENGNWIVIRRKKSISPPVQIPLCEGIGNLTLVCQGTDFLRQAVEEQMPIYAIEQIPKRFSSGVIGQVYKITMPDKKTAIIKVKRTHVNVREGVTFDPIRLGGSIAPLSLAEMIRSFEQSECIVRESCHFQKSPHYAECYGLVYVQELNVWAVAYEYLEGEHPSNYSHNPELGKKIFASIAEGLKVLDEQRAPHTDLKNTNILIRKDGMAMFFDDVYKRQKDEYWSQTSEESKREFGVLLSEALSPAPEITQLIHSCKDMSWDEIIRILS